MKKVVNIVLTLCVAGLAYICVGSIMGSINFGKVRAEREKEIIARLIDIRTAQVAFRDNNTTKKGQYSDNFDELIEFVKKVGELTDKQREDGWTRRRLPRSSKRHATPRKPQQPRRKGKRLRRLVSLS